MTLGSSINVTTKPPGPPLTTSGFCQHETDYGYLLFWIACLSTLLCWWILDPMVKSQQHQYMVATGTNFCGVDYDLYPIRFV